MAIKANDWGELWHHWRSLCPGIVAGWWMNTYKLLGDGDGYKAQTTITFIVAVVVVELVGGAPVAGRWLLFYTTRVVVVCYSTATHSIVIRTSSNTTSGDRFNDARIIARIDFVLIAMDTHSHGDQISCWSSGELSAKWGDTIAPTLAGWSASHGTFGNCSGYFIQVASLFDNY